MPDVAYQTVPNVHDWRKYPRWCLPPKDILAAVGRVISQTVPHGVSDRFRVPPASENCRESKDAYYLLNASILFIGHLHPQKHCANLLEACSFARLAATMVGGCPAAAAGAGAIPAVPGNAAWLFEQPHPQRWQCRSHACSRLQSCATHTFKRGMGVSVYASRAQITPGSCKREGL